MFGLGKGAAFSPLDYETIGKHLSGYDLVCISSMSDSFLDVTNISNNIKKYNSEVFVLYGGVHPTLYPDEAIKIADAICVGEGEKAFKDFFLAFKNSNDYSVTAGMWFKSEKGIIKNKTQSLNTNEELNEYQMGYQGFDSYVYDVRKNRFRAFNKVDYIEAYWFNCTIVWTLGCPFTCVYCSNSGFKEIDKGYLKLRYPSPDIVIKEIENIIAIHPYVAEIFFQDDNLITLPFNVLRDFAELYKKKINKPFSVFGVHPNTLRKEKIELLAQAGMTFVRMGIQSGNEKMLKFYERNTSPDKIAQSVAILADCAKQYKMMPPLYDVIIDNPLETKEDIFENLKFFNNLKRPFQLNIFSLRTFPGTKLSKYFEDNKIENADSDYFTYRPPTGNVLMLLTSLVKIPDKFLEHCKQYIKDYNAPQRNHPVLLHILIFMRAFKMSINFIQHSGFSLFWRKLLYRIIYAGK
jgi:radical SAM superfamily enzyme YgiQ (UPF0313 family)